MGPCEELWFIYDDADQWAEERYLRICLLANRCTWRSFLQTLTFPLQIREPTLCVVYCQTHHSRWILNLCYKKKMTRLSFFTAPRLLATCLYGNNIDLHQLLSPNTFCLMLVTTLFVKLHQPRTLSHNGLQWLSPRSLLTFANDDYKCKSYPRDKE